MAPKHTRGGGTAEILVGFAVIAVIAVLAALLFPILATTRGSPRKETCQNHLKECAIALQIYWSDYDNHLPSSAIVSHSKKWNSRDSARFTSVLGAWPPKGRPLTWAQALYKCMASVDWVFCPADPVGARSRVSYCWKTAVDKAWYGVGCKRPCRKLSDFKHQADQIVLYERAGFHCDFHRGLKNGVTINVAFLDTHVKIFALRNCAKGVITDPASIGEPMYFNFDNAKPAGPNNPPPANVPATHIDPTCYSDRM